MVAAVAVVVVLPSAGPIVRRHAPMGPYAAGLTSNVEQILV